MAAAPPRRLRLGAASRIQRNRDFLRTKNKGQRVVFGCLIANWLYPSNAPLSRLGVVTSKKLGNAVARNRARRLLREAFRLHQHELSGPVDLILIARQSITGKAFGAVEKDFLTSMDKAGLLKGAAPGAAD